MTKKNALITGILGQDGFYLSRLLLDQGYQVIGITSHDSFVNKNNIIKSDYENVRVEACDFSNQEAIHNLLEKYEPSEIYNLAAHSFLPDHKDKPAFTADITALFVTRMLQAIKLINPSIKFFQASSSEIFGDSTESPQSEETIFQPQNLYAIAKVYAHLVTKHYREVNNIFSCAGILYNHESPRRNLEFVTRKVTYEVAKIKLGMSSKLYLGNLDSRRDWGFAGDYVVAMWLMMQQKLPEDYVISSGETHSIRELCDYAFSYVGLNYESYVEQDIRFMRPQESSIRVGNSSKAERKLGWKRKVTFREMIERMVENDMALLKSN